jgi:hypothetical protein
LVHSSPVLKNFYCLIANSFELQEVETEFESQTYRHLICSQRKSPHKFEMPFGIVSKTQNKTRDWNQNRNIDVGLKGHPRLSVEKKIKPLGTLLRSYFTGIRNLMLVSSVLVTT